MRDCAFVERFVLVGLERTDQKFTHPFAKISRKYRIKEWINACVIIVSF